MYSWSKTRWVQLSSKESKLLTTNTSVRVIGRLRVRDQTEYTIYQDITVLPTAKCVTNLHRMFNRFVLYRPVYVLSSDGSCPPTSRDDRVAHSPTAQEIQREKLKLGFRSALGYASKPKHAQHPQYTDAMQPYTLVSNTHSSDMSLTSAFTSSHTKTVKDRTTSGLNKSTFLSRPYSTLEGNATEGNRTQPPAVGDMTVSLPDSYTTPSITTNAVRVHTKVAQKTCDEDSDIDDSSSSSHSSSDEDAVSVTIPNHKKFNLLVDDATSCTQLSCNKTTHNGLKQKRRYLTATDQSTYFSDSDASLSDELNTL